MAVSVSLNVGGRSILFDVEFGFFREPRAKTEACRLSFMKEQLGWAQEQLLI